MIALLALRVKCLLVLVFGAADVRLVLFLGVELYVAHLAWISFQD